VLFGFLISEKSLRSFEIMADIKRAIADQIQGLTLLEASQLVKLLEEKLAFRLRPRLP